MTSPMIELNDGNSIPQLGFGLWQVTPEQTIKGVLEAAKVGYRSFDGAQIYANEEALGEAIKRLEDIKRKELFITTKIWNDDQGRDNTLRSFDASMKKLGLEELDLLLIHWPSAHRKLYKETWKALVELKKDKRVKSIGVSNFCVNHLHDILDASGVVPVINQIELHPYFQQKELRTLHDKLGIKTEAWSPLGQGKVIDDVVIGSIAKEHGKTPAQVILRWHMQRQFIAIPKSVTPERIKQNFQVFDFTLTQEEMTQLDMLDRADGRVGPDPATAKF